MVRILFKAFFCLFGLVLACPGFGAAPKSLHHDLKISLFPSEKRLLGIDTLSVDTARKRSLTFSLSKRVRVLGVQLEGRPITFTHRNGWLRVPLRPDERQGVFSLTIRYEGIFDDLIPAVPLNTDNPGYGVTGVISEKGCFLQAGAGWYPEIPESRATYRLCIDAPAGVVGVSAGRCLGHKTGNGRTLSTWEVEYPLDGLSLSAARYVIQEKLLEGVRAATYFFPESSHLARAYLDATGRYIALYEELFGSYPFDKFAVVENFFPTGYGFPSYTLLGSTVIRLPFIIHTSLGHEIAHCWWGNGVYVDFEKGNWSEALTTYVADYLFKERASEKEAQEYRIQVLRNFTTLVPPQRDFPLRRFQGRYDPASQAIGYSKGAMVFHMLRRYVGEKAFWNALREIYRDKLFQKASWEEFQKAFERNGTCSLQRFFDQWISRKGAPKLALKQVTSISRDNTWQIRGQVVQKEPSYDLELTLTLKTRKQHLTKRIKISGKTTPFEISCNDPPERLIIDPEFHTFRYLYPPEIPPSVNAVKGSPSVILVVSKGSQSGAKDIAKTLALSLGLRDFRIVAEDKLKEKDIYENDLVLIGFPERGDLLHHIPRQVVIRKKGFTVNGRSYGDPSDAFFGIFSHPFVESRIMGLFLPLSMKYARQIARKVTHYGKYSYLAFSEGRNQEKGIWPVSESPLIHQWGEK